MGWLQRAKEDWQVLNIWVRIALLPLILLGLLLIVAAGWALLIAVLPFLSGFVYGFFTGFSQGVSDRTVVEHATAIMGLVILGGLVTLVYRSVKAR